jgi:glutamine amidotransferase-like uncharacterized protein
MKQVLFAGVLILLVITIMAFGITPVTAPLPEIRIALYSGNGTIEKCTDGVHSSLSNFKDLTIDNITEEEISSGKLKDYQVVIFPGGTASKERNSIGKDGCRAIERFISEGGGYIGICAGAYIPTLGWKDSMKDIELINAELHDLDNWARGTQEIECTAICKGGSEKIDFNIHFENGPIFTPGKDHYMSDYVSLAKFKTDLHAEDAPEGQMAGNDAIIASRFGRGRVILFSPHPELTPGLENMLAQAVRWSAGLSDPQTEALGSEYSWEGIFGISGLQNTSH